MAGGESPWTEHQQETQLQVWSATLLSGEGQKTTKDYMLSSEEERSSYSRARVPLPCLSAAFLSKVLQSPQSPCHSFKNTNDAPGSQVTVEAGGPPVWHPNIFWGFDASVTPMCPSPASL